MRSDRVGIGDDSGQRDMGVVRRSRRPDDSPRRVELDRPNPDSGPQLDTQLAGQADQGLGDRARAAAGIPDSFAVCMWAMPQSTAGERSGDEPTYWVK